MIRVVFFTIFLAIAALPAMAIEKMDVRLRFAPYARDLPTILVPLAGNPLLIQIAGGDAAAPSPLMGQVADDAVWAQLLDKVRRNPDLIQSMRIGNRDYLIHILRSGKDTRVEGQNCPTGTEPSNAIYLATSGGMNSDVVNPPSPEIYPVRIAALCMGALKVHDVFNLEADSGGKIINFTLYRSGSNPAPEEGKPPALPADPEELRKFLKRLVETFLKEIR